MHDPSASRTGFDVKFSEAISSMPFLQSRQREGENQHLTKTPLARAALQRTIGVPSHPE
jgi:hypothetical protein